MKGVKKNVYRISMVETWRRLHGEPRRGWDDNIKVDFKEIGWENVDYVRLARSRDQWRAVVNTAMNISVA
jgi:hypothetical protein